MKKAAALLVVLSFLLAGCGTAGQAHRPPAERSSQASDTTPGIAGKKVPPGESGNWVKVNRVIDGDTFEIINRGKKERVRLIGVDTPESVKPGTEVEPFAIEASNYTKKLIEGKLVRLEFDVQERDKYGRLLAYVYLEDGSLLNARLLEEGLAAIFTVPPNVRMADTFLQIQRKARAGKKGIWQRN
ncbi:MAG: thermonuclease family protein [Peptococcaceae bacterium]|nr:thermonuclease family protein [Peptococcaceae bacterium]